MSNVAFWHGMTKAQTVELLDKILLGRNADGKIQYADFNQLINAISASVGAGIEPTVEPGTILPAPEQSGKIMIMKGGNYTQPDGETPLVAPDNSFNVGYWDGLSWEIAISNGTDVNLDEYAKKTDVSPVIWGVGDIEKNIFIWADRDLNLHMKLHPNSWPIKQVKNHMFDLAFQDTKGNIILGVGKDGKIWPPQQNKDSDERLPHSVQNVDTLEQEIPYGDVSKDGAWNQWIEPLSVEDSQGNVWIASVGRFGNLYVSKRTADGKLIRVKIGAIRTNLSSHVSDDHNAPAILLDERPGAEYPIMIFQCDHNTTPMRMWTFSSLDPRDWDVDSWSDIPGANLAYCQPHRYGDEIFVFARRPNLPRPWRILYSSNNGATWTSRDIFSSDATWLYMLTKMKDNGAGLNIGCVGHPINSSEQSVYFLELDFVSGEVRSPGSGVVIPDIRAAISNSGFTPIDPFSVGMVVYQAQGSESCRMWDVSRGNTTISIVLSVFPSLTSSMNTFNNSIYRAVTFSSLTGSISRSTNMGQCGMPTENPKGNNFYVAGACLLNNNTSVFCVWKNKSMIEGGQDIKEDFGETKVYKYDLSTNEKTELMSSDLKVMRPVSVQGYSYVVFFEAQKYVTYDNFKSNAILISKTDYNL